MGPYTQAQTRKQTLLTSGTRQKMPSRHERACSALYGGCRHEERNTGGSSAAIDLILNTWNLTPGVAQLL